MTGPRIVQHLGFDADFYHPKGRDLKLSERVIDAYENAKERARVFIDVASGAVIDAPDVLKRFARQGLRERLEEHEKQSPGGGMVTIPIAFPEGVLRMETEDGLQDVRLLTLIVRIAH
jgi:hypothetical protein